ncbi:hypothetical protein IQ235_05035 [Oscillatoriales cyanobacterium LEGE 11467]|uniref:Uncharacterized protein n=1 Tax=Zarconia navalis LEGE 11467 TaxID=1828826 RepID=A0A928VYS5_9CYAN|nr:hypothetical protein [Zarconia navalis]MBE9040155.1 hypothetical protein [Zarconia navalis LEGE 11467]
MLGIFQQSHLRVEVEASATIIQQSLLYPEQLQQWWWPQRVAAGLPEQLAEGLTFTSTMGSMAIQHHVDAVGDNYLRLLLSQGIDGFHEWYWGEGWVQSRLEGISLLPLNLGQTLGLMRLRQFVSQKS